MYPVILNLKNKNVLIVGAGTVAERKIDQLLKTGCRIIVVAKEINEKIKKISKDIIFYEREFNIKDLENINIVFAATNDSDTNKKIAEECFKKNILLNSVDDPTNCSFYVPSIIRRGDLIISVSSSGTAPHITKSIRKKIEKTFGEEWGNYIKICGQIREVVIKRIKDEKLKKDIFNILADNFFIDIKEALAILKKNNINTEIFDGLIQ